MAAVKIPETVLRDEVTKHPERYKLIKFNQASFTKGKSFLTNLVAFLPGTGDIKRKDVSEMKENVAAKGRKNR